jgi:hypothetical protein
VPEYLDLAISRYDYGSANLVGCPGCVTFRGRCALVSPASLFWTLRILCGNEGLPVGCAPDGPANTSGCLGTHVLKPSLGRHASSGSARLCAAMQDIWISLHYTIQINIVSPASLSIDHQHCNFSYDPSMTSSFDAPFKTLLGILGYWALLFKVSSRSARL